MKKIVIAIDSFKGSLSSHEAGIATEKGIKTVFPDCKVLRFPVADGGEGILEILVSTLKGHYVSTLAHNPLMQTIETRYGISGDEQTAFVEMAAISGLTLIPPTQRNPMLTTSFGTGELIREALDKGCRKFIVGIGGSATNDAGLGMLQALGMRFLDQNGNLLGTGGQILSEVHSIDTSFIHPSLNEADFTIACDVNNPLYGPQGATRIYARQKGATTEMVELLDHGMQSFARVIARTTGKDISQIPGTGAAGGMGGGFMAFLNARLVPGIELILTTLDFSSKIKDADLIITGEGSIDTQTARGKVAHGILQEARKQKIPVIAVTGNIDDPVSLDSAGFNGIFSITPGPVSLEKAMNPIFAKANLQSLITQLCRMLQAFNV